MHIANNEELHEPQIKAMEIEEAPRHKLRLLISIGCAFVEEQQQQQQQLQQIHSHRFERIVSTSRVRYDLKRYFHPKFDICASAQRSLTQSVK